jgi:hypothetical protein
MVTVDFSAVFITLLIMLQHSQTVYKVHSGRGVLLAAVVFLTVV